MVSTAECRDESLQGGTLPAPMFSSDLGGTSRPARGLLFSLVVHGLLAVTVLYAPLSDWMPGNAHLATAQSLIQEHKVLLLPKLEPMGSDGSAAPSSNGGNAKKEETPASSYDAKSVQGVVYNGPQLVVSNSPHPDNFIQTIRQPDLALKPKLPAPLPLPPMVSIAPAKQILAPPTPQPTPDVSHENLPVRVVAAGPITLPPQQRSVAAPKLSLPPASSADALLHAAASTAVPAPMPGLAHQDAPMKTGKDARNILVVDALPQPDRKPPAVPAGELYGTFTVSPAGATAIGLAGGGTDTKGAPGMADASGSGTSPYAGNGHKSSGRTNDDKVFHAGVGPGNEAGHGTNETGHASINGGKTGNGSGAGVRASGSGSGSGTGSGTGTSPFPSIMIQGGTGVSGRDIARASVAGASKPQTSYGITIVANGGSGGGFKDLGVFRNEASYTVYLDMADAGASGSSWTLQYAVDARHVAGSSDPATHPRGALVPPYATAKSLPHFSSEAASRGRGGTIVVFGIINLLGKFEDLRVMQSPDAGLNQLLLDSLRKWTFQPAGMDGTPVPVKVLLGVPVNSVPGE
jgi:hypothetical protein